MADILGLTIILVIIVVAWGNGVHFRVKLDGKVHEIAVERTDKTE